MLKGILGICVAVGLSLALPAMAAVAEAPNDFLRRGVFAEGRLWLLSDNGQLFSVRPDDMAERAEALPADQPVADICKTDAGLVALSEAKDAPTAWTIWVRNGGNWAQRGEIPAAGESPLAVTCGATSIAVLTATRLVTLTDGETQTVPLSHKLGFGIASTLVTPAAVYVGLNRGEWGGGLSRIDLATGEVSPVSNVTSDLCGGLLNPDCDPVNGLSAVPWQPDCIVAAIGLVHMIVHGRVVTICGGEVKRLYRRPFGKRFPNPLLSDDETSATMAFFGLVAEGDRVLAVGLDGLYSIDRDGKTTITPLPAFKKAGPFRVSFKRRDVAIIMTSANERLSLSGAVPMLVPTPGR